LGRYETFGGRPQGFAGSHGNIQGFGGQSVFRDGSQPTLLYHSYDGNNNGAPTLGINRLRFDAAGWPFLQ
jgi:arabinan endo-1,5-alpha-L-arabinosidase